jgi:diadenosine tetraphosphate (Ap4A) HIT family hydrolase
VHIVARFEGDAAWPGPIWGVGEAEPFDALPDWALDVRASLGWSA